MIYSIEANCFEKNYWTTEMISWKMRIVLVLQWRNAAIKGNFMQHIRPRGNCCVSLHRYSFARKLDACCDDTLHNADQLIREGDLHTNSHQQYSRCIVLMAMHLMFWQQFHRYFTQFGYSGPQLLSIMLVCETTQTPTLNGFEKRHRVIVPCHT